MPVATPETRQLKARLARHCRDHAADHPSTITLRRDYLAAVLAEHVARVVDTTPSQFTDAQIGRIVGLLRGGAL